MIIEVKNLLVKYQGNAVLERISFNVGKGDYVGIVGPNGSGKTTLLKSLLGLLKFDSGEINLYGNPIGEFQEWKLVGYLPQTTYMSRQGFPASVEEIVASGLLSRKKFPKTFSGTDHNEICRVLELLQIGDLKDKMIGKLSGGQLQRVMLARALAGGPEAIFLDEPTAALDPGTRKNFYGILEDLNKRAGLTVLLVSHDSSTIGEYASKMMYLDREIIFYGNFADFCKSEKMAEYFGKHSQHLICHQH